MLGTIALLFYFNLLRYFNSTVSYRNLSCSFFLLCPKLNPHILFLNNLKELFALFVKRPSDFAFVRSGYFKFYSNALTSFNRRLSFKFNYRCR